MVAGSLVQLLIVRSVAGFLGNFSKEVQRQEDEDKVISSLTIV